MSLDDYGLAVAAGADGSAVFVTGTSGGDYQTVAYDAVTGHELWARRYQGARGVDDRPSAVAASPDGTTVFVTGTSFPSCATVAYDATTGRNLWASRFGTSETGCGDPVSLEVSPDGSHVFIAAESMSAMGWDFVTVAYAASTGATLWAKRYDGPAGGDDRAMALTVSPRGTKVFVTGESVHSQDGYLDVDFNTVAYSAETGSRRWVRRFGQAGREESAQAISTNPSGTKVFVAGDSFLESGDAYAIVAYSAGTGTTLWKRYSSAANGGGNLEGMTVSPTGARLFVTGWTYCPNHGFDYSTVAYATDIGSQLWARHYDGPRNDDEFAQGITMSPDGRQVVVSGTSIGTTSYDDYATVAYAADTGTQLWVRRYNGPANRVDEAAAIVRSASGTAVFVTGTSWDLVTSADFATVGYDVTDGARLWVRRFDGPGEQ